MRKIILITLLIIFVFLKYVNAQDSKHIVGLWYLQVSVPCDRATAHPIPDFTCELYTGPAGTWNVIPPDVQKRHFQQISELGVDFVSIDIRDPRAFDLNLLGKLKAAVWYDFGVTPANTSIIKQLADYVYANYVNHPNYFYLDGKPLLLFWRSGPKLDYADDRFTIRWTTNNYPNTDWLWWEAAMTGNLGIDRQTSVFPGYQDGNTKVWVYPRSNGDFYKQQWNLTLGLKPDIMMIISWNDFWEGTFIESNTLDKNIMINLTGQFILQYKKLTVPIDYKKFEGIPIKMIIGIIIAIVIILFVIWRRFIK